MPLDARSMEYELYVSDGEERVVEHSDYTSANTERLDLAATEELLRRLPELQRLMGALA